MSSIKENLSGFKSFLDELKVELCRLVTRRIEQQLEAEVSARLYRTMHQRRCGLGSRSTGMRCGRCGSRHARDFSRNGHRQRQMVTSYGVITFWLPRVVCGCGGSVRIPFSLVEPYQRLWDDVLNQVERWAQLGLSLRQMQAEIGTEIGTQVGLRKLNALVQTEDEPARIELTRVPPVILVDAIWVTVLVPSGERFVDKKGRWRWRKQRQKVAILVALGLWPQSQHWRIVDWELADGEDHASWERLLVRLENRGVYRERGVELFIHDGGGGIIAALNLIYPHVPHQRCVFHKLRNLWQVIQTPDGMKQHDVHLLKRDIMHQAAAIYRANTPQQALTLRDAFCRQWQNTQPKLVDTLLRDWDDTVTFYHVMTRFPKWKTTALRTTSLLERLNRMLRRLFRPAGAYHSLNGLLATVARVLNPLRAV